MSVVTDQHAPHASMKIRLLQALEQPPKEIRAVLNRSRQSLEISEVLPRLIDGSVSSLAIIIDWPENEYVWMSGDMTVITPDEDGAGFDFNPTALRFGHFQRGNEAVLTMQGLPNWLPFWPSEDPTYSSARQVLARALRTNRFARG